MNLFKQLFDKKGREIPDQTPIEVPLQFRGGESMEDRLRRIIRTEMSRHAQDNGHETWEEANDFEISDDPTDFPTHHEMSEEQEFASTTFDPDMHNSESSSGTSPGSKSDEKVEPKSPDSPSGGPSTE